MEPSKQQTPEGSAVSRDVGVEVAGGYLLGSTIMAFLSLWALAMFNLQGLSL